MPQLFDGDADCVGVTPLKGLGTLTLARVSPRPVAVGLPVYSATRYATFLHTALAIRVRSLETPSRFAPLRVNLQQT